MAAVIKLNGINSLSNLLMTLSYFVPQEEQRGGALKDDSMTKA